MIVSCLACRYAERLKQGAKAAPKPAPSRPAPKPAPVADATPPAEGNGTEGEQKPLVSIHLLIVWAACDTLLFLHSTADSRSMLAS